jgi:hypothetical protein
LIRAQRGSVPRIQNEEKIIPTEFQKNHGHAGTAQGTRMAEASRRETA